MVTHEIETVLLDCPACGGWYVEDTSRECGYCPHAGVIEGTCPECGAEAEPTMAELVAELLDAADCMVVELASYPVLFALLTSALPTLAAPVARLRQIVTRLQGTAGLRVVGGGEA